MLLREYLELGQSKSALAAKLGISRRTIYHWISSGQLDRDLDDRSVRYKERPPTARKVDAYRAIIDSRLAEFPRLSAVRLYAEVKAAGYDGGYTQVKEYVREVRPVSAADPVVRFETPAGHQAQVDFAHFRLPWGLRWALVVVLSYSRLLWVRFFCRQDMSTLFSGLEQAFQSFGGVPVEALFDQMRAVVLEDQRFGGGPLVENAEFARFAHHWQFRLRACRAYRARTKGKVERPIRYLRENFFYGRSFLNDEDLDEQLQRWLHEVANVRVHATTGERPLDRFLREEQSALKPLAERPYRSLILSPVAKREALRGVVPRVEVQRRPLQIYSELVGGRR